MEIVVTVVVGNKGCNVEAFVRAIHLVNSAN